MNENVILKNFLSKRKSILIAFDSQRLGQLWWSAIENGHFAFFLVLHLLKHFIPIGAASICACLEASDQITFFLQTIKTKYHVTHSFDVHADCVRPSDAANPRPIAGPPLSYRSFARHS